MKTVCHTQGSLMCYPDVTPGARQWAWNNEKPTNGETITVSVHGLRRLLRAAAMAMPFVTACVHTELRELYARDITQEKSAKLLNELSSIWCEGDLVMSRLFVDKDGNAIAHANAEIDGASIAPWEKQPHASREIRK